MKLIEICIENFRGIRSLRLPLDKLTVLIGENNIGKSTILDAIRLVLTRSFGFRRGGQFSEYDFHLQNGNSTPQAAPPIKIILHFAEEHEDEWPDTMLQQMEGAFQLDKKGLHHAWFMAEGSFNTATASFETKWAFLDVNGAELNMKSQVPFNLLPKFAPIFFLSALRDASQEFGQRGQFWSGFLKSIQLPPDKREQIEKMLQEVNTSVISANAGLTEVIKRIADAKKFVSLDSIAPVILEAIPTRVFDMTGKIQVHLKSTEGVKLPLSRHGEGTQSLAVLMLFQAFVSANLAEVYTPESKPILALEEPEAHLHPSAVRSLGPLLQSMTGQILVSSHSGDLVSRIPLTSLRRLYRKNGETMVGHMVNGLLDDREIQAIDYSIHLTKGHCLFSRCWLLVEGESDFHIMPLLLELSGFSQDQCNLSILEISQVVGKGEPFIKFSKAFGIQWFMIADNDSSGKDYVNRAKQYLENGEILADRAQTLHHCDIEHEFWHSGYDNFMTNMISTQNQKEIDAQANGDADKKITLTIKKAVNEAGGKPAFARTLAIEVHQRGAATIPQTIQDIIKRVIQLTGG